MENRITVELDDKGFAEDLKKAMEGKIITINADININTNKNESVKPESKINIGYTVDECLKGIDKLSKVFNHNGLCDANKTLLDENKSLKDRVSKLCDDCSYTNDLKAQLCNSGVIINNQKKEIEELKTKLQRIKNVTNT